MSILRLQDEGLTGFHRSLSWAFDWFDLVQGPAECCLEVLQWFESSSLISCQLLILRACGIRTQWHQPLVHLTLSPSFAKWWTKHQRLGTKCSLTASTQKPGDLAVMKSEGITDSIWQIRVWRTGIRMYVAVYDSLFYTWQISCKRKFLWGLGYSYLGCILVDTRRGWTQNLFLVVRDDRSRCLILLAHFSKPTFILSKSQKVQQVVGWWCSKGHEGALGFLMFGLLPNRKT